MPRRRVVWMQMLGLAVCCLASAVFMIRIRGGLITPSTWTQVQDRGDSSKTMIGTHCRFVPTNSGNLTIQVVNANVEEDYSVLVESLQRYVSSGTRTTTISTREETTAAVLNYTVPLPEPGDVRILVHHVKTGKEVTGSPIDVQIPRGSRLQPDHRPSCQSLPYYSLTSWRGHWVGPMGNDKHTLMRTGWAFQPEHCRLDVFTKQELLAARTLLDQRRTICVLGTHVHRGVFLSLLDMALDQQEKEYSAANSPIRQCWGRASVQLGNLKFEYQDMRLPQRIEMSDQAAFLDAEEIGDTELLCHNDEVAAFPGMVQNATRMFRKLFARQPANWPTVILLGTMCQAPTNPDSSERVFTKDVECARIVRHMINYVPMDWKGTIYVTNALFHAQQRALSEVEYIGYSQALREWNALVGDARVRMLDTVGMSTAMRLWTESQGQFYKSPNFHAACRGHEGNPDIRVRSNVTEALAQLLLGRALDPNARLQHSNEHPSDTKKLPVPIICLDCPPQLLPLHIKAVPDLQCITGSLEEVSNRQFPVHTDWDQAKCPASCVSSRMERLETPSGILDVKKCSL